MDEMPGKDEQAAAQLQDRLLPSTIRERLTNHTIGDALDRRSCCCPDDVFDVMLRHLPKAQTVGFQEFEASRSLHEQFKIDGEGRGLLVLICQPELPGENLSFLLVLE